VRLGAFREVEQGVTDVSSAEANPDHESSGQQQLAAANDVRCRATRSGHRDARYHDVLGAQGALDRNRKREMSNEPLRPQQPHREARRDVLELGWILDDGGVVEDRPLRENPGWRERERARLLSGPTTPLSGGGDSGNEDDPCTFPARRSEPVQRVQNPGPGRGEDERRAPARQARFGCSERCSALVPAMDDLDRALAERVHERRIGAADESERRLDTELAKHSDEAIDDTPRGGVSSAFTAPFRSFGGEHALSTG